MCRLETVYEIAGDFRPTTSGSTKRGKIKLWTEDGMCVLYLHMYINVYTYVHTFHCAVNVNFSVHQSCPKCAQCCYDNKGKEVCLDHKYSI